MGSDAGQGTTADTNEEAKTHREAMLQRNPRLNSNYHIFIAHAISRATICRCITDALNRAITRISPYSSSVARISFAGEGDIEAQVDRTGGNTALSHYKILNLARSVVIGP